MDATFTHALADEVTTLQAQFPDLAERLGRAQTLIADGRLFSEEDGRTATVASKDGSTSYTVNGSCICKAALHRHEACYHRLALRLYQKVSDRLAADEARSTVDLEPSAHVQEVSPVVKAEYLVQIQGRPFVRFEGLLAMAHERGLQCLETTIVQCTYDLAVCQSTATFNDGRVFTDIGDAAPTNVPKHLAPAFVRMAATRASARALRRALNLSLCSVEELDGSEVQHGS